MCNAGKIDRILRVVVGIAMIAYGVLEQNYIIAGIGTIPFVTGAIGFCPLYPIFKINTGCKKG